MIHKKNKILFIVPDGVGIRNYLYSNLIAELKDNEITILSTLPKEAFYQIDADFKYQKLTFEKESFITRLFRETATFARLCYNAKTANNHSILKNWNYHPKGFKLKVLNKFAEFVGKWVASNYQNIVRLEKIAQNNWSKSIVEFYKNQLKDLNPKAIFITHQRVASLMPICLAAKELNIPVISTIYSWDNLPKGRLAVRADKYVVWSDYMKAEMKQFYPEIPSENVLVTGTPQFEFYLEEDKIINRNEFANQYGLETNRKWICFSGDDVKTSPYDPEYLQDVAEAVSHIEANIRPQIIFRRCPVDFSTRYDEVLNQYKDIIVPIDPIWNVPNATQNWGVYFPKKEDISLQVNLAFHCEAVVNLGSTMAHDFAMFNKPCFYYNYDPVADKNWSVKTIYNYQHFRSMEGLDAVGWLHSKESIQKELEKVIGNEKVEGKDRKLWLQRIVLHPVNQASKNIAQLLNN